MKSRLEVRVDARCAMRVETARRLQRLATGTDSSLQPSDAIGALFVAIAAAATLAGLWLSAAAGTAGWVAGQALLAVALLQWFILLHEAGHLTLFRTRALNLAAGHLAGALALIPFAPWRHVHGLHHVWAGWQDKDPTTASLAPRPRGRIEIMLADVAWRTWLPLFSLAYRLGNYWNLPRLHRLLASARQRRTVTLNAAALLAVYAGVAWAVELEALLRLFGVATVASLALQDPLILSQHTHIPQRLSLGRRVAPLTPQAQAAHTRSLRFPGWFAHWVLINFNAHELHHRCAGVPGYRLANVGSVQLNEVHWWTWLRAAKRLRGSVFVFQSRGQTGFPL